MQLVHVVGISCSTGSERAISLFQDLLFVTGQIPKINIVGSTGRAVFDKNSLAST